MGTTEGAVGSGGTGGTGGGRSSDTEVARALRELRTEQTQLRLKVEGAMKEGGPITKLANELMEVRRDFTTLVPEMNGSIERLRREMHPVSRVEKMVLVVGAVVICNLALRLISGTLESPLRHGTSAKGLLQGISYLLTP